MDGYFSLKDEETMQILIPFVRLAPSIRYKLDDYQSINKLDQCLKNINNKYNSKKGSYDLVELLGESMAKLKDSSFLQDV